jgi:predicted ferric reductase
MSLKTTSTTTEDNLPQTMPFQEALLVLLITLAAILFAINLMPLWLPGLAYSESGDAPQVYWFLSRGSAMAGYWILWLSMTSGVMITNKMAQKWPGIPPAYEVHQYTSLLGLAFGLFHALILTGDHYINYTILQVLIPFNSPSYRPTWVGIGQIAFYVWAIVNFSFYVRKRIGKKAWRLIHFASFASFVGILIHGFFSGTDASAPWAQASYWLSGGILLFLIIYRVVIFRIPQDTNALRQRVAAKPAIKTNPE